MTSSNGYYIFSGNRKQLEYERARFSGNTKGVLDLIIIVGVDCSFYAEPNPPMCCAMKLAKYSSLLAEDSAINFLLSQSAVVIQVFS